jgi:hypothetical protein
VPDEPEPADTEGADPEPVWPWPGHTAALEPETEPNHPVRAVDAAPFLPKVVG